MRGIKGIPRTEKRCETYHVKNGSEYIVTAKGHYEMFYLYSVSGDTATKIAKAKNPNEFKEMLYNGEKIYK